MGEAGGGKAEVALSYLSSAGGELRTDGGAKPMPERGFTTAPFGGTLFDVAV